MLFTRPFIASLDPTPQSKQYAIDLTSQAWLEKYNLRKEILIRISAGHEWACVEKEFLYPCRIFNFVTDNLFFLARSICFKI